MTQQVSRLSRRNVLIAGGGAVAAAGAFAISPLSNPLTAQARDLLAGQSWARTFLSLARGTFAEWQSVVGSNFAIGGGGTLRLAGVVAFASSGARPYDVARRSGFLAVFEAGRGQTLAGDLIYTITHAQYGPLQIFLTASPDARQPGTMHAVFN